MRTPHVRILLDPATFQPFMALNLGPHKIRPRWSLETMMDAKAFGNKSFEYLLIGHFKDSVIQAVPDVTGEELLACWDAVINFKYVP